MGDASLSRRKTLHLGPQVAFAQIGAIGFNSVMEIKALRLYGLPGSRAGVPERGADLAHHGTTAF